MKQMIGAGKLVEGKMIYVGTHGGFVRNVTRQEEVVAESFEEMKERKRRAIDAHLDLCLFLPIVHDGHRKHMKEKRERLARLWKGVK